LAAAAVAVAVAAAAAAVECRREVSRAPDDALFAFSLKQKELSGEDFLMSCQEKVLN